MFFSQETKFIAAGALAVIAGVSSWVLSTGGASDDCAALKTYPWLEMRHNAGNIYFGAEHVCIDSEVKALAYEGCHKAGGIALDLCMVGLACAVGMILISAVAVFFTARAGEDCEHKLHDRGLAIGGGILALLGSLCSVAAYLHFYMQCSNKLPECSSSDDGFKELFGKSFDCPISVKAGIPMQVYTFAAPIPFLIAAFIHCRIDVCSRKRERLIEKPELEEEV